MFFITVVYINAQENTKGKLFTQKQFEIIYHPQSYLKAVRYNLGVISSIPDKLCT